MREAVEQRVLKDTPAQRWAEPREIGEVRKPPDRPESVHIT